MLRRAAADMKAATRSGAERRADGRQGAGECLPLEIVILQTVNQKRSVAAGLTESKLVDGDSGEVRSG